MVKTLFVYILVQTAFFVYLSGQNLCPNPNFQEHFDCPFGGVFTCSDWEVSLGTPDYYHPCHPTYNSVPQNSAGFQYSAAGGAYIGIAIANPNILNVREFISAELIEPLVPGCYEIKLFYSNPENFNWANHIGAYVSVGIPANLIGITPQCETTNILPNQQDWLEHSALFYTEGGETHISIGNFRDDNQTLTQIYYNPNAISATAYVYVDSVSLTFLGNEVLPVDIGPDITVCTHDFPVMLNSGYSSGTSQWSTGITSQYTEVYEPGNYSVLVSEGCQRGYDTIIISIFDTPDFELASELFFCEDSFTEIYLDPELGDYQWSDGTTGPYRIFDFPGFYTVDLVYDCGVVQKSFEVIKVPFVKIPEIEDVTICESGFPYNITLHSLDNQINTISWSNGTNGPEFIAYTEGEYFVRVENSCYSASESFNISIAKLLPDSIPFDRNPLCKNDTLEIIAPLINANYLWQDSSTQSFFTAIGPGHYQLTMSNECGSKEYNFAIDTLTQINIDLGQDKKICPGDSILLSGQLSTPYQWNTGQIDTSIWVKIGGEYIASFTGPCGLASDTIVVTEDGTPPMFQLVDSLELCLGDTILLAFSGDTTSIHFLWSTGNTSPMLNITEPGVYTLYCSNSCGTTSDSVLVLPGKSLPDLTLPASAIICPGDSIQVQYPDTDVTIQWNTGSNQNVVYPQNSGVYYVDIFNECSIVSDSIMVEIKTLPEKPLLPPDLSICHGDTLFVESIVINDLNVWNTGQESHQIFIYHPGLYILEGANRCGKAYDTIEVFDLGSAPLVDLGPDRQICTGDSIFIKPTGYFNILSWNTGQNSDSLLVNQTGIYIATALNDCGTITDTVEVVVSDIVPPIDLGPDLSICRGTSATLQILNPHANILWSTGETGSFINVENEGWYSAELITSCGSSFDSIYVSFIADIPQINLGMDTMVCEFFEWSHFLKDIDDENSKILWNNGDTTRLVQYSTPGTYWVTVSNECSSSSDTISIGILPKIPDWRLPADTVLCDQSSYTIQPDRMIENVEYFWNGVIGLDKLELNTSGLYILQIKNECSQTTDSIQVVFDHAPKPFSFPKMDTLCSGETIVLSENQGNTFTYTWQDGSHNTSYQVTKSGLYQLMIKGRCGEESSQTNITVLSFRAFESDVSNAYFPCIGDTLFIDIPKQENNYIEWSDGTQNWSNEFYSDGEFTARIYNYCHDTIIRFYINFEECKDDDIFIPNIFSPNDDGENDYFSIYYPEGIQIIRSEIRIYDRWGENVFFSQDPFFQWYGDFQGNSIVHGVYVFLYEAEISDGRSAKKIIKSGDITITR